MKNQYGIDPSSLDDWITRALEDRCHCGMPIHGEFCICGRVRCPYCEDMVPHDDFFLERGRCRECASLKAARR